MASSTILVGDNRHELATLAAKSVHMSVTSPPYWSLRSYLPKDHPLKHLEIGSEPTFEDHVANLMLVFDEVYRVLRDDGVFFLNYGDSYSAASTHGGEDKVGDLDSPGSTKAERASQQDGGLDAGQLMLMPQRIAMAMQQRGWILRSSIVWCKGVSMRAQWEDDCDWAGSVMPESVAGTRWEKHRVKVRESDSRLPDDYRGGVNGQSVGLTRAGRDGRVHAGHDHKAEWEDCPGCEKCKKNGGLILRRGSWRPTSAYEMLYMFSKSMNYYADAEAVKEISQVKKNGTRGENLTPKGDGATRDDGRGRTDFQAAIAGEITHRNLRNVWCINTTPSAPDLKHYAMFPESLVEPCIKVGTSDHGACSNCGAPWARVIEKERVTRERPNDRTRRHLEGEGVNSCGNTVAGVKTTTLCWKPTCSCPACEVVPSVVLDPFGGAGTTALVAKKLGRSSIVCELNERYVDYASSRVNAYAPLFSGSSS